MKKEMIEETSCCFSCFSNGKLQFPGYEKSLSELGWAKHPVFEGVELKHIVTSEQTGGKFSFHLVRIEPHKKIGSHIHEEQLETHEVITGSGACINGCGEIEYSPGTVSIFQPRISHEVTAGPEGLCLFAKFFPALC